ncbi:MAG: hypothetical protein ACLPYS_10495 [Vulcanimicrobiaceae bacterium]
MNQCCNAKTRGAKIAGALWEASVLACILVGSLYAGHAAAGWMVAQDPHMTHLRHVGQLAAVAHVTQVSTALASYAIAATIVGAGFLMRHLPPRVMIPLGSPIAWGFLVIIGLVVGVVALPVIIAWKIAGLVVAIAAPERPIAQPTVVNVTTPPAQVFLVGHDRAQYLRQAQAHRDYLDAPVPVRQLP